MVDKNRVDGTAKEIKGSIKEGVGKLVGNERMEAEGNVEKNAGKVEKNVGKVKDAVRDTTR